MQKKVGMVFNEPTHSTTTGTLAEQILLKYYFSPTEYSLTDFSSVFTL